MTRKKCLQETIKMWDWIADKANGEEIYDLKALYFKLNKIPHVQNNCFCCEMSWENDCGDCPLLELWTGRNYFISPVVSCEKSPASPYRKIFSGGIKDASLIRKVAKEISSFASKELSKCI